jgi:hypothetical protein
MRAIASPIVLLLALTRAAADCPAASDILERISAAEPQRGARTQRWQAPPPEALYRQAADEIGKTFVARDGKSGVGVTVARLPVESLWMAINDEGAHDAEGDYLPLVHSEVLEGSPRSTSRLLFQYARKMGVGRWWVSRVQTDGELYATSNRRLWQVTWDDDLRAVDPKKPPIAEVSSRMPAIAATHGAWLLVPLSADCTLVEHYSYNDAGGAVEAIQFLVMRRALHDTVNGMVRLAGEHYGPDRAGDFVRPDGTPLR